MEIRPTKYNILYCVASVMLFFASIVFSSYFTYAFSYITKIQLTNGQEALLSQFVVMICCFLIVFSFKRGYIFELKGVGFWKGVLTGGFFIFVVVCCFSGAILNVIKGNQVKSIIESVNWIIYYSFVGIAEECIFRGTISELILDKYILKKWGIKASCLLTGVFFGIAHLFNAFTIGLMGVIIQSLLAVFVGACFTAIYYRSGNIWAVCFIHAINDIGADCDNIFFTNHGMAKTVSSYGWEKLLVIALYIALFLFLLRPSKLKEANEIQIQRRKIPML